MDKDRILVEKLSGEFGLVKFAPEEELAEKLAERINQLLVSDFNKLVSILYRLDISETKLKQMLSENPDVNAGAIMATMIIEREHEKIKSRENFKGRGNVADEEKW